MMSIGSMVHSLLNSFWALQRLVRRSEGGCHMHVLQDKTTSRQSTQKQTLAAPELSLQPAQGAPALAHAYTKVLIPHIT